MKGRRLPRGLVGFWCVVAVVIAGGAGWLQYLGPIAPKPLPARRGAAIPAPSPALLVPSKADASWRVPHPGPYGIVPMHYYAADVPPVGHDARVAILVGGLGYARKASMLAVKDLPAAVSLGLSPYGAHSAGVAEAARKAGHETIMGLPMQTDREPEVTEGDRALNARLLTAQNRKRLDWALSRVQGYAGATDALGMDADERFLTHKRAAAWLAKALTQDGLFLVVATPDAAPPSGVAARVADVTIAANESKAAEAQALKQLTAVAIAKGSALAVMTRPVPRQIATLAAWCKGMKAQGIALVPVSALAAPSGHLAGR